MGVVKEHPKRLGVISDTHGLLRPAAIETLRGSELIIHAGDIGGPEILEALRELAPVVAVRGNRDGQEWASLPETAVVEAHRALIYVIHDVKSIDLNPEAAGFRMVISGHSHQASRSERGGVIYLNPGSAGPKRFNLPIVLARVDLDQEPWTIEFVDVSGAVREKNSGRAAQGEPE
jgi:putative phosphoesterase